MRRGTFRDDTVDYAAVGATHAPDLMQYPPERSIPAEQSWRIGSGAERFQSAGDSLLTWTAQRAAGLSIEDVRPASGPAYAGVSFDAEGNPVAPSKRDVEQRFDAEGTPFVGPGMTLRLHGRVSGMRADAELRVISVTEETATRRLRARHGRRVGRERRGVLRPRVARGQRRSVVHGACVRCAERSALSDGTGPGEAPPPRAVRPLSPGDLTAVRDARLMARTL